MVHSPLGAVHLFAALAAVVLGAIVLRSRKATRLHRRMGYGYVVAMLSTNLTALGIYGLSGKFNMLHGFALLSLSSLFFGILPVMRGRPDEAAFERHYQFMSWSYIGLCAALVAESATRMVLPLLIQQGFSPKGWFWALVGIASFAVAGIGGWWLRRAEPDLQRYRPRPRPNAVAPIDSAKP